MTHWGESLSRASDLFHDVLSIYEIECYCEDTQRIRCSLSLYIDNGDDDRDIQSAKSVGNLVFVFLSKKNATVFHLTMVSVVAVRR